MYLATESWTLNVNYEQVMMKTKSLKCFAWYWSVSLQYNVMHKTASIFPNICMTFLIWYHLTVNATLLKYMASWPEFPSDFPLMKQLNLKQLGFVYVDFSLQFHHTLPLKTSRIQHSKFLILKIHVFQTRPFN